MPVSNVSDAFGNVLHLCDASGGPLSVVAPAAALTPPTTRHRFTKTDSSANAVTLTPGSGTIGGAASYTLAQIYDSVELQSDGGTNLLVVASSTVKLGRLSMGSPLSATNLPFGAALTSNTAYWIYVGRTDQAGILVASMQVVVTTGGTGAQTAEIAVGVSADAPKPAGNTIGVLEATAFVPALTGTGVMSQAFAGTTVLPRGAHVWIGPRTAMAATQPIISSMVADMGRGYVQTTAAAGVLAVGNYTGTVPSGSTLLSSPNGILTVVA